MTKNWYSIVPVAFTLNGLGIVKTTSGLGMREPSAKVGAAGSIPGIAFGRAGFDPVGDRLFLLGTETDVVGEMAILGIGVPGGHAALAHDLVDRVGPADRFLIRGERERADFSRAGGTRRNAC